MIFFAKQKTALEGAILNSISLWASVLVMMIILMFFVVFYIVYTIKELKILQEKVDSFMEKLDNSSDNHNNHKSDSN